MEKEYWQVMYGKNDAEEVRKECIEIIKNIKKVIDIKGIEYIENFIRMVEIKND